MRPRPRSRSSVIALFFLTAAALATPGSAEFFQATFPDVWMAGVRANAAGEYGNLLINAPANAKATITGGDWQPPGGLPFEFTHFNIKLRKSANAYSEEAHALAHTCARMAMMVQHDPERYDLVVRVGFPLATPVTSATSGVTLAVNLKGEDTFRCFLSKP